MRRLALGVAAAAAMSAFVAAPAGAALSRPFDLSRLDRSCWYPDVGVSPAGTTTIAWSCTDPVATNLVGVEAVRIDANGNETDVFSRETSGIPDSNFSPRVSVARNGTSMLAWMQSNGSHMVAQAVRIDAAGRASNVFTLSDPNSDTGGGEDVATAADGTATVVWSIQAGGKYMVQAMRIDPRGRKGPTLNLSAPGEDAYPATVTTTDGGTSTVTWSRWDTGKRIVQAVRIDPRGKKGAVMTLSPSHLDATSGPEQATAPDGTTTVVWTNDLTASERIVGMARIGPRGNMIPATYIGQKGGYPGFPTVATAPNGTSTIVWMESKANARSDGRATIQGRRVDRSGRQSALMVLSDESEDSMFPSVASAADGSSTVIWYTRNTVAQAVRIDARGFESSIVNLSAPVWVMSKPVVATARDGTSTVAWGQVATTGGVRATVKARRMR